MSKDKVPSVRGIHVSPGIYTAESELSYAVKSLGITTLGLVGETVKGPAFQPVPIKDWREFTSVFGGTNPEKFKGSQYPKYELPYIAKSYLSESNQLQVCRVLGLSGYNAGPAWVVAANYKDSVDAKTDEYKEDDGGEYVLLNGKYIHTDEIVRFKATQYTGDVTGVSYIEGKYKIGNNDKDNYVLNTQIRYALDGKGYKLNPKGEYVYSGGEWIKIANATTKFYKISRKNDGELYQYSNREYRKIEDLQKYSKNTESTKKIPVAVLRSRGEYLPYRNTERSGEGCCNSVEYDGLRYFVGETTSATSCESIKTYNMNALSIGAYIGVDFNGDTCDGYYLESETNSESGITVNPINYGRFTIYGLKGSTSTDSKVSNIEGGYDFKYSVSLNPNDKDYILNVLGTDPQNGTTEIYVEALYDVALKQGIEEGKITSLANDLVPYEPFIVRDYCKTAPITDLMTIDESGLRRKDVGKRYLATYDAANILNIKCHPDFSKIDTSNGLPQSSSVTVGTIYTVKQFTDKNGKRHYFYAHLTSGDIKENVLYDSTSTNDKVDVSNYADANRLLVKNLADGLYYKIVKVGDVKDVRPIECDMNNYRDSYRYASTPWIVSNVKGDFNKIELTKLFRFHTISDGNNANFEIKISIVNIKLDDGTFDVYIRDINDTDASPIILEKYTRCTMVPGDSRYIGYMIGTFDGSYESKSKYVTVEVNEDSVVAKTSVPAGFLGYPLSKFDGVQINASAKTDMMAPQIKYNCNYDDDLKHRKQYFGLSDIVGVDIDSFTYKGQAAYIENDPSYLSDGFHLDCRINKGAYNENRDLTITVDGQEYGNWQTTNVDARTEILEGTPMIDTEANMEGSIFEYVDLRKFTVYFYGGFDGWDIYRTSRSNTDDFKQTKYKGDYDETSGEGYSFNKIDNPELLQLNQKGITSDWYAYLSAIRQFANPENVDINVFATPGIDLINNKLLCQEAIDMIEEERADSIYVATIPDKPFGATDFESDMYLPDELVEELEDTEIDSNYTCTYYPWVKYEDTDNNQFIMLPPTKDVVRNMAMTDNTAQPWFSPAGITRGNVDCVRAHKVTKIGDEDVLYEGRINPVKTFASDGVKIWGNKNLQHGDALLTRIHVRRLILRMRKLISIACIGLIFEPNDNTVKSRFLSLVSPIMDNIKSNRGISDYRIEVDDSLEVRERRELNARIFFKPYNSLEYINISFVVTPQSITFDEL